MLPNGLPLTPALSPLSQGEGVKLLLPSWGENGVSEQSQLIVPPFERHMLCVSPGRGASLGRPEGSTLGGVRDGLIGRLFRISYLGEANVHAISDKKAALSGKCRAIVVTDSGKIQHTPASQATEETLVILKQLRLSRGLSQEQLAQMSGLNVRTVQRIESGHKASVESLKCLASVLEVDLTTLNQETFMIDKTSVQWQTLPTWLKWVFACNFLDLNPTRKVAKRIEIVSHITGFVFCALGFISPPALAGGLIMLANAYSFYWLLWLGDKYGVWYDVPDAKAA